MKQELKFKAVSKKLNRTFEHDKIDFWGDPLCARVGARPSCPEYDTDAELFQFVIKDRNGNRIYANIDHFIFNYWDGIKQISLVGHFEWNQDELRYEVKVQNKNISLMYLTATMKDFELINNAPQAGC